jgi:hypothetical protein
VCGGAFKLSAQSGNGIVAIPTSALTHFLGEVVGMVSATSASIFDYFRRKVGALGILVIGATFWCNYAVYQRISGVSSIALQAVGGLTTFYLMFLQLRLIDDLADLDSDLRNALRPLPVRGRTLRSGLLAGLGATIMAVALLNQALITCSIALLAVFMMLLSDLVLKKRIGSAVATSAWTVATRWLTLVIFYEGAPFLIFLYVYYAWASSSGTVVSPKVYLVVTTLFWTGYEFWKYSRHIVRPDWNSYRVEWAATRSALFVILVISFICQAYLARFAGLPETFAYYAAGFCAAFAGLLWRWSPDDAASRGHLRKHVGILYLVGLDIGLLAAIFWP